MNKPKKPLRGLFARTETPQRAPEPKPVPKREIPGKPSSPSKSKRPAERLAPPPRHKLPPTALIMKEEIVEVAAPVTAEPAPEPVVQPSPMPMPAPTPAAAPLPMPMMTSSSHFEDNRLMAIQYNFDGMRTVRENWAESDYISFLRRLDQFQTEAFLLKGKVLGEAKIRFFETNKLGWAQFCESDLGLNYTTANQYIRVAQEFDVTSHQRPDFGFEHFKALLPLSLEERAPLLEQETHWSVKTLRNKVAEILRSKPTAPSESTARGTIKQSQRFIRSLESIKQELALHGDAFRTLNQTNRWQVAAACQNIAAHLLHLARLLNDEPATDLNARTSSTRAGASATVELTSIHRDDLLDSVESNPSH